MGWVWGWLGVAWSCLAWLGVAWSWIPIRIATEAPLMHELGTPVGVAIRTLQRSTWARLDLTWISEAIQAGHPAPVVNSWTTKPSFSLQKQRVYEQKSVSPSIFPILPLKQTNDGNTMKHIRISFFVPLSSGLKHRNVKASQKKVGFYVRFYGSIKQNQNQQAMLSL